MQHRLLLLWNDDQPVCSCGEVLDPAPDGPQAVAAWRDHVGDDDGWRPHERMPVILGGH